MKACPVLTFAGTHALHWVCRRDHVPQDYPNHPGRHLKFKRWEEFALSRSLNSQWQFVFKTSCDCKRLLKFPLSPRVTCDLRHERANIQGQELHRHTNVRFGFSSVIISLKRTVVSYQSYLYLVQCYVP